MSVFDFTLEDDPVDCHLSVSAINQIVMLRDAVGKEAAMNALTAAREGIRANLRAEELSRQQREKGLRRYLDTQITNEAFRAELMNLDGLDEATQARLKALRQTDPMGYAAELGLARMAEAERRAAAALDAKQ